MYCEAGVNRIPYAFTNRTDGLVNVRLIGNRGQIHELAVEFRTVETDLGQTLAVPPDEIEVGERLYEFDHLTETGFAVYLETN